MGDEDTIEGDVARAADSESGASGSQSGASSGLPPAPPDRDGFTVHYQLTPSDIRSAGFAASRFSVVGIAVGAFVLFTGAVAFLITADLINLLIGLVGLLWLTGLLPGLLMAFMAGRRPEIMQLPTDLTVSAAGIRTVTPLASGEAAWATYKRLRSTGSTLLLELGTGAAVLVPRRAFTVAQIERVEEWADAAGVLDRASPVPAYAKGLAIGGLAAIAIPLATWMGYASGILS